MSCWIILELEFFYNDILKIKSKKNYLWRHVTFVFLVSEVHKFTLKISYKQIYFYIYVSLTKYIFISNVLIFSIFEQ